VRLDRVLDPEPGLGPYVEADVRDYDAVTDALRRHRIIAVIHCAGLISVAESVEQPLRYWDHNVGGSLVLLKAMDRADVRWIVFSSSAAVYGEPEDIPLTEDHPRRPTNPYGRTKAAVEEILEDAQRAGTVEFVALRYFNAAGAIFGVPGERHDPETHLIPNVVAAARGGPMVAIYGSDYPTPDGTAVRDYVHIEDLAEAHVLALRHLERGGPSGAFNLSNSRGYSVREVVSKVQEMTGQEVPQFIGPRRPGDAAVLIGSSTRARTVLGWRPRFETLDDILKSVVAQPPLRF
jgi:UDP-glucose-4-epimerase GalE